MPGSWFFDHRWIINAILFGQYDRLVNASLSFLQTDGEARVLQLSSVYGSLTSRLLERLPQGMDLTDVASQQLARVRSKCPGHALRLSRMNAECLGYADNAFDRIVVFFLFHEMPREARMRVRKEIARILRPGGRLIVSEYAEQPSHHCLFRFQAARWLLCRLEPFLADFWSEHHD
ncbi:MAG: class I SAM-dependent methyltransferase, partial [Zetaproteobacteria bacterium]